jgi:tetratricopeptide (TPR) repeat protein
MAHLGRALQAQGKSEGAGPYIAELIELRRREASAQDAIANKHNSYAWLLLTCEPEELRDPQKALTAARTAAALSGRHDAEILDTLALAQKMTGDLSAAIETQKEAIALLRPGDFLARMPYEQTLAEYYREAGELEALEAWYRDMLARTRAATPAGSLAVGVALSSLGSFLIERGNYVDAESAFREVLEIVRGALPEGHWRIADVESTLGLTMVGQKRFDEAEPLIVDSLNRLKDDAGVPAEHRTAARQRAVRLYTDWEKPEEAARFRSATD